MSFSANQYLVKINTGVEYPYYNQKTYHNDIDYPGDLDDFEVPKKNYMGYFKQLFDMDEGDNGGNTTARAICQQMLNLEQQSFVNAEKLEYFKFSLDKFFAKKAWAFDNLSELTMLQRQLAKVAVDLYERKRNQLNLQEQQKKELQQRMQEHTERR
jgi:hypothetical protein